MIINVCEDLGNLMSHTIPETQFDDWNNSKKKTHYKENNVGFKEREIFWARIGQNIGAEEFGKGNEFQRPVLIIRKLTSHIFIGIPLTSTIKDNDYFHTFEYDSKKGKVSSTAMILQLKTFDKKRWTAYQVSRGVQYSLIRMWS